MGVHGFATLFKPSSQMKSLKNMTLAVDAFNMIYRASLGMADLKTLTDPSGQPSTFIRVILFQIMKLETDGCKQIWVFDSDKPSPLKAHALRARLARRDAAPAGSKASFKLESWMIEDVKFMLDCFGIRYIDAPAGIEAECICAALVANEYATCVYSNDFDSLLFGAKCVVRKLSTRENYELYKLEDVLTTHSLTQPQLVRIGVVLGCDFLDKSKYFHGIGPVHVVKAVKDGSLVDKFAEEEVVKVLKLFAQRCKISDEAMERKLPKRDTKKLKDWLVKTKGFNPKKIFNGGP